MIKRPSARPPTIKMTNRRPATAKSSGYAKIPTVLPRQQCYLRILRLNRLHDYLLMEEVFIDLCKKSGKYNEQENKERRVAAGLRGSTMAVAKVMELYNDGKNAIIQMEGSITPWYVPVLSIVDQELLSVNSSCLIRLSRSLRSPSAVVGVINDLLGEDIRLQSLKVEKAPNESFGDIGGLDDQICELKEAVELPLTHPELYEQMGIKPPKGVILYGEPGTGKTLLAKAVANNTKATFLRITASAMVKKTSGEGPQLVRNLFKTAKENSPCILFIDEIDAIGSKRYDTSCGGEKEVQRTMLELLNQLDGFDSDGDVKVIMATNRIDSLDPALIRPGRIDRKIEIPRPDLKTKKKIFQLLCSAMTLSKDVDLSKLLSKHNDFSGADIKAICTEAGLCALREQRRMATMADFEKALSTIQMKKSDQKQNYFL